MDRTIPLTDFMNVKDTTHIVYFYEDEEKYIQNLLAYISEGANRNDYTLVIENEHLYEKLDKQLQISFSADQQKYIHYINNDDFYGAYRDFHIKDMINYFEEIIDSYQKKNANLRTWAHVEFCKHENVWDTISKFEKGANCSVKGKGVVSVCAYAASSITASNQNVLMHSHEYMMTDRELVKSSFYNN